MFRVLGGVAVELDGELVPLQPQLQRLVGVLLADRGQIVATEVIVERMWPTEPPKTAVKVVQVLVGRLRRQIGADDTAGARRVLVTSGHGYGLADVTVDLDEYLELAAEAERLAADDPIAARRAADAALARWVGRPWGEQADDEWLAPAVEMLEERHRRTEELWADLVLRGGGPDLPLERLGAAARAQPLRERRWAQLMLGLYRSERQADALRAYEQARVLLREELGVEPGPELRRLQLSILQHDPSLSEIGPPETAGATSFVGRDTDLRRLDDALARSRVVTIVGLGGIGKSRLASEHVHRQRLRGARVRWAALGSLAEPARLFPHVAAEVGVLVDDVPSAVAAIAASIGREHTLLVLDAAERVVPGASALALQLVDECPRLRILVTSRVPIGLPGERTVELGPLALSTAEGAVRGTALELLIDRLNLDTASLDLATREHLAEVCRASGGVPLLIELSAAGVDLTRRPRDQPAIDRTIRSHHEVVHAAIEQALDTVDVVPRQLVRAMSTLPGGVSERSAAAIMSTSEDAARRALRLLSWTHLVDAGAGRASLRYRSLDPVREALIADLDDDERAGTIDRATTAMGQALTAIKQPGMPIVVSGLDALDDEHDNIRFLLADRLAVAPAEALELAIPACEFWPIRGHIVEGRYWLGRGIDEAQPLGVLRWRAVVALARTTRTFGEVAELLDDLESVTSEMRTNQAEPFLFGTGLLYLAMARGWRGDRRGASAALSEADVIDARVGTPWTRAHIDQLRALDLALSGNLDAAREGMRRFGRTMEELNDPVTAAMGWYLAATMGDLAGRDDLRDDITRARRLAEPHGDVSLLNQLIRIEARLLQRVGDPEGKKLLRTAAEHLAESGGLRAAALARLDLALVDLHTDAAAALEELQQAVPVLLLLDRAGAALGTAALATYAAERGHAEVSDRLAALAGLLDAGDQPTMPADRARMQHLLDALPPPAALHPDTEPAAEILTILEAPPFARMPG